MPLDDSLEFKDIDNEDTYRVGMPLPLVVANEEEFITNSGRRVKKYSPHHAGYEHAQHNYDSQRLKHHANETSPPLMTDSLQAQLHLSLDRLSEHSYDQDDLNRIKVKNQDGKKTSIKTYPAINQQPFVTNTSTNVIGASLPRQKMPNQSNARLMKNSFSSQDSLNRNETEESDEDDVRTVITGDSLHADDQTERSNYLVSGTQEEPSDARNTNHQHGEENDPYSHLRYNPEWRTTENINRNEHAEHKRPMNFSYRNSNEDRDYPTGEAASSPVGSITLHNKKYSPIKLDESDEPHLIQSPIQADVYRDSPVRLSSDPSLLLHMNKKYEEEFNKLMRLERQQSGEQLKQEHQNIPSYRQTGITPNSRSKLKPPISYVRQLNQIIGDVTKNPNSPHHREKRYSPSTQQTGSYQDHQVTSQHSRISSSENKLSAKNSSTFKKPIVPTPPKAPKSNRDFIELNKARLGRKSNSASYLEMYSKKNKQVEETNHEFQRPKSDTNEKNMTKSAANIQNEGYHDMYFPIDEDDPSVEDQWKYQVARLRIAKGEQSLSKKSAPRRRLREVGNHAPSKPQYKPEHMTGVTTNSSHASASNSEKHRISPKQQMRYASPKRGGNGAYQSEYSNHPAFTPFMRPPSFQPESYDKEADNSSHEDESGGYNPGAHNNKFSTPSPSQRSDKTYTFQHNQSDHMEDGYVNDNSNMHRDYKNQPYVDNAMYHNNQHFSPMYHVSREDMQYHQSSPLIQAYQQRFSQPMLNHGAPVSPRKRLEDNFNQHYGDSNLQLLSDSSRNPFSGHLHEVPHQKLPLPPHPFSQAHRTSYESKTSPFGENYLYNNAIFSSDSPLESNRMQSVPHLPPIIAASKATPRHRASSYDSGIVEPSPRHSMSDSEAGEGGYLERYERRKKKPSYKKYTLDDYKSLKRDINLGGLGPDLLSAKSKMEKVNRGRKYAEFIRQQHKNNSVAAHNKSHDDDGDAGDEFRVSEGKQRFTLGKDSQQKKEQNMEKRKRAIEYARNVPKPKTLQQENVCDVSRESDHKSHEGEEVNQGVDWELLKSLRDRHEREKAIVAEMTSPRKAT